MSRYWTLGSTDSLDAVGRHLAELLETDLEERESDYRGGRYLRGRSERYSEVIVQRNEEDEDGLALEPQHVEFPYHRVRRRT
ncbi:hypothetical protein GCM10028772_02930 [Nocardioides ultimimeridianus]